jgi:hypothetical protein
VKRLKATAIVGSICALGLAASPALAQTTGTQVHIPDPIEIVLIVMGALAVAVIGVVYAVQSRQNGKDHK